MLDLPGWVRRGGSLRTPSGPRGSSGKEEIPGAAGEPARAMFFEIQAWYGKQIALFFQNHQYGSRLAGLTI